MLRQADISAPYVFAPESFGSLIVIAFAKKLSRTYPKQESCSLPARQITKSRRMNRNWQRARS
jgi:hypothetical protein